MDDKASMWIDEKAFGKALASAREGAGLKQEDVLDDVEVKRQTVSRWENRGDVQPQTRYLALLARASPEGRDAILAALEIPIPLSEATQHPQVRRFTERMATGVGHPRWEIAARIIDDALRVLEELPEERAARA